MSISQMQPSLMNSYILIGKNGQEIQHQISLQSATLSKSKKDHTMYVHIVPSFPSLEFSRFALLIQKCYVLPVPIHNGFLKETNEIGLLVN